MISRPDQRVAVFIDTQNMYYSARNVFNQKVNFGNIVKDAVGDRKLIRATAYVVSTKTGEETPFFEALQKLGIETKEKELMTYISGLKKADWDVGIAVDAIKMLDMVDVIVLVSGDGDFIPLAEYVRSRGRLMEVISFRETTSTRLTEAVDKYTNMSENKRRYLISSGDHRPTTRRNTRKPAKKIINN
ncbi:NYN domain-containing protein [Patescibacteria group bacterium]|nr:NYN domain-containing protein [Patescibacteria group bacterium]MBU1907321.1 NYN domain-containing protein [Patescibacteria group bacterium]